RRRHTRFSRDWSSDVCSSDLDQSDVKDFGPPAGRGGPSASRARRRRMQTGAAQDTARRVLRDEEQELARTAPGLEFPRYFTRPRSEERRVGKGGGSRGWQESR